MIEFILIVLMVFVLLIVLGELMYFKFACLIFSNVGLKIMGNLVMLLKLFLVMILVGIVVGSYFVFFLVRLRLMEILKWVFLKIKKGVYFR